MAAERFRAAAPQHLVTADLEGLTAIYHRPSGQTHIVAEPVPDLIACLNDPLDMPALLDRLGLETDAALLLSERLSELIAAGLVERL